MFKSLNELTVRAFVEFIVLALILGVIGHSIYTKVDEELTKSLEESVALQAQSLAFGIEQQSKHMFEKLRTSASLIEQGKLSPYDFIDVSLIGMEGEKMGIVTQSGDAIAGTPLDSETLNTLHSAFIGTDVIKYRQETGMIFAVPINING